MATSENLLPVLRALIEQKVRVLESKNPRLHTFYECSHLIRHFGKRQFLWIIIILGQVLLPFSVLTFILKMENTPLKIFQSCLIAALGEVSLFFYRAIICQKSEVLDCFTFCALSQPFEKYLGKCPGCIHEHVEYHFQKKKTHPELSIYELLLEQIGEEKEQILGKNSWFYKLHNKVEDLYRKSETLEKEISKNLSFVQDEELLYHRIALEKAQSAKKHFMKQLSLAEKKKEQFSSFFEQREHEMKEKLRPLQIIAERQYAEVLFSETVPLSKEMEDMIKRTTSFLKERMALISEQIVDLELEGLTNKCLSMEDPQKQKMEIEHTLNKLAEVKIRVVDFE